MGAVSGSPPGDTPPGGPPPGGPPPSDTPPGGPVAGVPPSQVGATGEPVGRAAAARDPLDRVTLDASLTNLLLVVLDSLPPANRVAFVLHDVFGVPYGTIAQVVGRSPAASKELARSARRQIHHRQLDGAAPNLAGGIEHELVLACSAGDPQRVADLLHPEVTVLIDRGALGPSTDPIRGVPAVAALLIDLLAGERSVAEQSVNGRSGLVLRQGSAVVGIVMVNIRNNLVLNVWIAVNPGKLRHWNTR
jgi:RNA polymerase sigma-70 factor (ECF subfamily)